MKHRFSASTKPAAAHNALPICVRISSPNSGVRPPPCLGSISHYSIDSNSLDFACLASLFSQVLAECATITRQRNLAGVGPRLSRFFPPTVPSIPSAERLAPGRLIAAALEFARTVSSGLILSLMAEGKFIYQRCKEALVRAFDAAQVVGDNDARFRGLLPTQGVSTIERRQSPLDAR